MASYSVQETRSGHKTLVHHNNREVRLHSGYDPLKEAERAVSAFDKGRASIIVVSGVALGYHLPLIKIKYPSATVIALEHDREAADICSSTYPDHLKGIAVIPPGSAVENMFEEADMADFRGLAHYVHRPSYALYPDFYDSAFNDINRFFISKISDLLTRFEFEILWITNILKNMHHVFNSGHVERLFGKFKGYPGIIVSAGPSLRKNLHVLAELQDKAVLVCVDTAFRVLNRKGITPHLVMTLDAQKHSIKHFLGTKKPLPCLLADLVSYPSITRSYEGSKIFSTTSKFYSDTQGNTKRETTPLIDWIEQYVPPIGDIQSGGSVATSAFDLLLNLGCSPIILVGQDLAYTGREIHCSGTHHNDDWLTMINRCLNLDTINQKVVRKRKIKRVESVNNETVISDFVFDLYKSWFEDSAAKVPVPVINATEGGARIRNTREEKLSDLASSLKTKKPAPGVIIDRNCRGGDHASTEKFTAALEQAIHHLNDIQSLSSEALRDASPRKADTALEKISKAGLVQAFNPFLKKTDMAIARQDIDPDRAAHMILSAIAAAAQKLTGLFEQCHRDMLNLK